MHTLYYIVIGPPGPPWLAGAVFVLGIIFRLATMFRLTRKRDPQVLEYMSFKYGLRSILAWSIPFFPVNSRRHPVLTVVTFLFHICLLLTPIFLMPTCCSGITIMGLIMRPCRIPWRTV